MVSVELAAALAVSKTTSVLTTQSSAEESEERLCQLWKKRETAQMKIYRRRRASGEGITTGVMLNMPEQRSSRDQDGVQSADYCKSDELQALQIRSGVFLHGGDLMSSEPLKSIDRNKLQDAYNKLFRKYQNLKTRQLAETAEAFDEQSRRIEVFSGAADDLVQTFGTTNSTWDQQEEMINRSRAMEAAYIECQNDLVIERARCLELRQRLENAELRWSKLLYDLLENTTQLTILNYGKSEVIFYHDQSGYEFKLEQNKLSEEVGGKDALLYNVVSPGTILHVAPEWMQSEIVFDMAQALLFLRRMAVALRGGASV